MDHALGSQLDSILPPELVNSITSPVIPYFDNIGNLSLIDQSRRIYSSPSSRVPLTTSSSSSSPQHGVSTSNLNGASQYSEYNAPFCNVHPHPRPVFADPRPPTMIQRRPHHHSSTNAAFNQLKETVVRVQQRKRQRDAAAAAAVAAAAVAAEQTGYQSTAASSTTAEDNNVSASMMMMAAAAETADGQDFRSDIDHTRRKIRRRDSDRIQINPSESVSQPTTTDYSTASYQRRCPTMSTNPNSSSSSNNQQITGLARQHESRNCHFCTSNQPQDETLINPVAAAYPHLTLSYPTVQRRMMTVPTQLMHLNQTLQAAAPPAPPPQPPQIQLAPTVPWMNMNDPFLFTQRLSATMNAVPLLHRPTPIIPQAAAAAAAANLMLPTTQAIQNYQNELNLVFNLLSNELMRDPRVQLIDRHAALMSLGVTDDAPIGVSAQEIEISTKRIIFEKKKKVDDDEDGTDRCTICLSDFEPGKEVRLLLCQHIFHSECIDKWLVYNKKCPVCRMEVDKKL